MNSHVCTVLGNNIRKLRKNKKITQAKLAEMLSMEVKSLSLIETGKGFISARTLDRLIDILNISPAELFEISDKNECHNIYCKILSDLEMIKNDTKKLSTVNIVLKSLL